MTSCILSLIKDEHEYLEDFITHHINIGIDKIFLYEDITSSSHKDICAKYPQVILASARDLLGNETDLLKKSRIFHMECIIRGLLYIQQNYDFDWCFSIDADEFIQLNGSLEQYKDYEALIISWVNYGYSGHILKPEHDKPIWEIFTQQCGFTKYDEQHGFITKVCYNMHKLKLHFIHGNHNALCNKVYPKDIHINHYITKSFEEWLWKINVRGITAKDHRGIQDFFEMHQNLKYEDIIQQYNYMRYSSKQSLRGYDKAALGSITPTIAGYVVVSDPRLPHEMEEVEQDSLLNYEDLYFTIVVPKYGILSVNLNVNESGDFFQYSIDDGLWELIDRSNRTSTPSMGGGGTQGNTYSIPYSWDPQSENQSIKIRFKGYSRYATASAPVYVPPILSIRFCYSGPDPVTVEGNLLSLIFADDFKSIKTATDVESWTENHSELGLGYLINNIGVPHLFSGFPISINVSNLIFPPFGIVCTEMFRGVPLQESPILPALTGDVSGGSHIKYREMFGGCQSLSKITCLDTNPDNYNYQSWVKDVSSNGIFVKAEDATWSTGVNGIPEGWTVQNA